MSNKINKDTTIKEIISIVAKEAAKKVSQIGEITPRDVETKVSEVADKNKAFFNEKYESGKEALSKFKESKSSESKNADFSSFLENTLGLNLESMVASLKSELDSKKPESKERVGLLKGEENSEDFIKSLLKVASEAPNPEEPEGRDEYAEPVRGKAKTEVCEECEEFDRKQENDCHCPFCKLEGSCPENETETEELVSVVMPDGTVIVASSEEELGRGIDTYLGMLEDSKSFYESKHDPKKTKSEERFDPTAILGEILKSLK